MSEHGDSPETTIDPDFQARPSRRFARLVGSPAVRRLSPRRLAWAALATLGAFVLVAVGGTQGVRGLAHWVATQPEHWVDFASIRLQPEAPPWVLSKSAGFLDKVREEAKLDERLPILEVDLKALSIDFSRNPWVKHVEKVEVAHHHLGVSLVFRRPIAIVEIKDEAPVVVDKDSVILPFDDIEWAERKPIYRPQGIATPLIVIAGFARPTSREPGILYKSLASIQAKDPCDLEVLKAARLADFLDHQQRRTANGHLAPEFVRIVRPDEDDVEGLFLLDSRKNCFYWGSAPGAERSQLAAAPEKWRMLLEWIDRHGKVELKDHQYLWFQSGKLELRNFVAPR